MKALLSPRAGLFNFGHSKGLIRDGTYSLPQVTLLSYGTEQNLSYDMAGGKRKFLQRNLLAPYEIIAKKVHCPVTLSIKMYLPRIHEQQMLHGGTNGAITKPFLSLEVFVDEKLNFEDEEI